MVFKSYKDLIVWQKAMVLVDETYILTRLLPSEERYGLVDQMRRAAVSIPSNIAEGQSRESKNEFKQFLSISKGSVSELETQIMICIRQGYIAESQAKKTLDLCEDVRKLQTKLISSLQ